MFVLVCLYQARAALENLCGLLQATAGAEWVVFPQKL